MKSGFVILICKCWVDVICIANTDVSFPAFIPDRSPVKYRLSDGSLNYGVYFCFYQSETEDYCYIIPLDSGMLEERSYDKYWSGHWHEHIPAPFVEVISVNELNSEHRESYRAFIEWPDARIQSKE